MNVMKKLVLFTVTVVSVGSSVYGMTHEYKFNPAEIKIEKEILEMSDGTIRTSDSVQWLLGSDEWRYCPGKDPRSAEDITPLVKSIINEFGTKLYRDGFNTCFARGYDQYCNKFHSHLQTSYVLGLLTGISIAGAGCIGLVLWLKSRS